MEVYTSSKKVIETAASIVATMAVVATMVTIEVEKWILLAVEGIAVDTIIITITIIITVN